MEPAAEEVAAALSAVDLQRPATQFYSVVDAARHDQPDEIKEILVRGITSRVRFADALLQLRNDGHESFLEVGPGRTLRGLVRQTLPGVTLLAAADDSEAQDLVTEAQRATGAKAGAS
jgi:[acyl-carrier-protein] S-malonyltransferase